MIDHPTPDGGLLPCPFCTKSTEPELKEGLDHQGEAYRYIGCPYCGARGPAFYLLAESEVIPSWNRRAPTTPPPDGATERQALEVRKHLDRALWEETRLGADLMGVNWQAVVGTMRGHVTDALAALTPPSAGDAETGKGVVT